ncbi:hypothetical protein G7Y89_g15786 [Cudoniella acicularis]|uniref:FAD-binding PCMH-type domain-containing protein n=1 Tax=Cudoniella acicularis TaxID=354080 RepID=A0A8H4VHW1_9HELO|nr:hypothetical protein G7Y89_g15786 [Cudoniella acicularis]
MHKDKIDGHLIQVSSEIFPTRLWMFKLHHSFLCDAVRRGFYLPVFHRPITPLCHLQKLILGIAIRNETQFGSLQASSVVPAMGVGKAAAKENPNERLPHNPNSFSYESIQLQKDHLKSLDKNLSSLLAFGNASDPNAAASSRKQSSTGCKVFPGDPEWPSDAIWTAFNSTLGGALIKTVPIAAPCYSGPFYKVQELTKSSEPDPSSYMSPLYQGNTCPPTSNPNGTCTLGGFPSYVVNATTVKQIQLAVNFARNAGIRFVVRNTGHEFSGKSGGAGALSVWTHYLNDIQYIPKFDDPLLKYSGPAFKGGSGVIARDLYKAAEDRNHIVVGGEGQDVGVLGGYIQGGGHSPMSPIYGMAADQILELKVVTPDGYFVTASSTENVDLFWAQRGGGGSTWGVVTSITVRALPNMPITVVQFSFSAATPAAFWGGVRAYWKHFIEYSDSGIYGYFFILDIPPVPFFQMTAFWAPNKTKTETDALLKPWFADLAALNITINATTTTYPSGYPAFINTFPLEGVGGDQVVGSRLFPRTSWQDPLLSNKTFDAWSSTNSILISFNIRAPNVYNISNAVLPAWRETVLHTIQAVALPPQAEISARISARAELSSKMLKWKAC